jgi:hypothetical protein
MIYPELSLADFLLWIEYVKPVITALNDVIKNAYHTNQRDSAEAGKYN